MLILRVPGGTREQPYRSRSNVLSILRKKLEIFRYGGARIRKIKRKIGMWIVCKKEKKKKKIFFNDNFYTSTGLNFFSKLIRIEIKYFDRNGRWTGSNTLLSIQQCIVNHLVLEQIASLAVTGTEWNTLAFLRIISISLPFFFSFVISLLGEIWSTRVLALAVRRHHAVGNYTATTTSWLPRRGKEINRWKVRGGEGKGLIGGGCNAHGNRNPGRAGRPRQLVSST